MYELRGEDGEVTETTDQSGEGKLKVKDKSGKLLNNIVFLEFDVRVFYELMNTTNCLYIVINTHRY